MLWEQRGGAPRLDGLGWAQKGVCAQEGFLAEVSLDVDLWAQVHISQEGKRVECLEALAVGTA